jgi:hypothetical protein
MARKAINDKQAAAEIRAILRRYLGQDLPNEVLIATREEKAAPGGKTLIGTDYMYIELKADKDK